MLKSVARVAVLLSCVASSSVFAQATLWEEYGKQIDSAEAVGVLGPTLFGDSVNYYTGALSFSATDVSVPGNNRLPVAVTRTMGVGHARGANSHDNAFADWDLQLPNISGVFATATGWVTSGTVDQRCSLPGPPPPIVFTTQDFRASEYWAGTNMTLLGGGGGELLAASRSGGEILAAPTGRTRPGTGGPYYWLTSDYTYVSCLPTVLNGTGEGFQAITSDGTKYTFNWMATNAERQLKKARRGVNTTGEDVVPRNRYALYATKVEDRFGNWVTYTYSNLASEPVNVTSIDSSDGRRITFSYNAKKHISFVTAGDQVWEYVYGAAINRWGVTMTSETLTGVILPDDSRWTIDFKTLSAATLWYYDREPGVPHRNCMDPGDVDDSPRVGTITHPSGAVGAFTVAATRLGRSNVLALCSNVAVSQPYQWGGWQHSTPPNDENDDTAYYPIAWDSYALAQKQISGPGLPAAEWNYEFFSEISWFLDSSGGGLPVCTAGDCVSPQCTSDSCAGKTVASICGPNNEFTRYSFGNSYRYNEGKLLAVDNGVSTGGPACAASSVLKSSANSYELAQSGQVFPTPLGVSPQLRSGAGFDSEFIRPQKFSAITQDGVTFTSSTNSGDFDRFARPHTVTRSSTLGYSKSETTEYADNLNTWVLGQTATVTDVATGKVMSQTDYDPITALPIRNYRFGALQNTLTYNSDGTLATVKDARNNVTTVSQWKRGTPQNIAYPGLPAATEKAQVNDRGNLDWVEDELTTRTNYSYDLMSRLSGIAYPTGDTVAWNATARSFVPVSLVEYGLPAGHWKQTVKTGNGQTTTFYDAQWRPVLALTEDTANAASKSFVVNRYDAAGRLLFTSYPVGSLSTVNDTLQGSTTQYDALGRVTKVLQDSELGLLTSTTEYLTGFQTRSTNPRGFQTTTSYQVFDSPDTSRPVLIQAPEGVTTTITRDVFGNPLSVSRSGAGN